MVQDVSLQCMHGSHIGIEDIDVCMVVISELKTAVSQMEKKYSRVQQREGEREREREIKRERERAREDDDDDVDDVDDDDEQPLVLHVPKKLQTVHKRKPNNRNINRASGRPSVLRFVRIARVSIHSKAKCDLERTPMGCSDPPWSRATNSVSSRVSKPTSHLSRTLPPQPIRR